MPTLAYTPFEKMSLARPVQRVRWIAQQAQGRRVLDLGCFDETALHKRGHGAWLHEEVARTAHAVVGIDSSTKLPAGGLRTAENSVIYRGDVTQLAPVRDLIGTVDLLVAGEIIEHLPDTSAFFASIKAQFPGREMIATTPNATSFTNAGLGLAARESCHPDHLQVYSFKTLNTLCLRAGFEAWEIRPYYVSYGEMILNSHGPRRWLVQGMQRLVNAVEWAFPMLAGGYIVHVRKI
jgi:SAM-dependent methyltransferase